MGLLTAMVGALLVGLTPAAHATDHDCADFPSQRAAQVFYLNHGGPQRDPHRLDADNDGSACDTNPPPYYTESRPPPTKSPLVNSAVRLKVSPLKAIAGEPLKAKAKVLPTIKRTVILQRKAAGGDWKRIDSGRTSKRGIVAFRAVTKARTSKYRAVIDKKRTNNKRYSAATSPATRVRSQAQVVELFMPNSAWVGDEVTGSVEVSPARRGREVVLKRSRASGGWKAIARGMESRLGRVRFDGSSQSTV